jgi:hypothetical protein
MTTAMALATRSTCREWSVRGLPSEYSKAQFVGLADRNNQWVSIDLIRICYDDISWRRGRDL